MWWTVPCTSTDYSELPRPPRQWCSPQRDELGRIDAYATVSIHKERVEGRWKWETEDPANERLGYELEAAMVRGDIHAVKTMVKEVGRSLLEMKDKQGMTPLMVAALCRNVDMVSELLELGADPHERNKYGDTALASLECLDHPSKDRTLMNSLLSGASGISRNNAMET